MSGPTILQTYTQKANWRHFQYKGDFGNIVHSANSLRNFLVRWKRTDQLKELDEVKALLLLAEQIARGLAINEFGEKQDG